MILPQAQDKQYRISHNSDASADIWNTRGIQHRGDSIGLAKKPITWFTNNDSASYGNLLAVVADENLYYLITNDGMYYLGTFSVPPVPTALPSTGTPPNTSLGRDAVSFAGILHVSGTTTVNSYSGGASGSWTSRITGLSSSYPIPLCVFEYGNVLAVGNGNTVKTYNTSYVLQHTLTIPSEFVVTWVRSQGTSMYVGTRNISGGGAKLFVWNGAADTGAQFNYGVNADWIYSGCVYNNGIAFITSEGQLLYFGGGGYTELANLPVYDTPYSWTSSSAILNATGKLASRGMVAIGKKLYLNMDGSVTISVGGYPGNYLSNQPSGLWEYTPTGGLAHMAGYTFTKYDTRTITAQNSTYLSVAAAHGLATGDPVYMNIVNGLSGGLIANQTYFAIVSSTTEFQLALSPADAANGRALPITGTPSTDSICIDTYTSVGATLITTPGTVALFNKNLYNVFFGTRLIFGGKTPDASNTATFVLMSLGLGFTRGTITTARMFSASITDAWDKLYARLENMLFPSDLIQVRYRVTDSPNYPTMVLTSGGSLVTWTSSTTFTATATNRDLNGYVAGDEIVIIQGAGAGYSAHLASAPVLAAGTWSVTIDEAIPTIVNGNRSEIMITNFKKGSQILASDPFMGEGYGRAGFPPHTNGSWLEAKLELRGRDHEFGQLRFTSVTDKTP